MVDVAAELRRFVGEMNAGQSVDVRQDFCRRLDDARLSRERRGNRGTEGRQRLLALLDLAAHQNRKLLEYETSPVVVAQESFTTHDWNDLSRRLVEQSLQQVLDPPLLMLDVPDRGREGLGSVADQRREPIAEDGVRGATGIGEQILIDLPAAPRDQDVELAREIIR